MSDVRLIDANALEKFLNEKVKTLAAENGWHDHYVSGFDDAITYVEDAPTIDAVPVVHGRWVETGKVFVHSMYDLFTKCSLCSFGHVRNEYQEPYRFCPNCGAKMDGGADNV